MPRMSLKARRAAKAAEMRAYRERARERGLVLVNVLVPAGHEHKVRALAERLRV